MVVNGGWWVKGNPCLASERWGVVAVVADVVVSGSPSVSRSSERGVVMGCVKQWAHPSRVQANKKLVVDSCVKPSV
jgi:hypothetical protein